ncbi:hypothetical protein ABZV60_34995 [Streptomyces sp. NPDC004787]|uniref:hypothetical protein n=1 Tax=Streptomyces sp. NPDC004787 TaxID=3154291 RepID=UPI0033B085D9
MFVERLVVVTLIHLPHDLPYMLCCLAVTAPPSPLRSERYVGSWPNVGALSLTVRAPAAAVLADVFPYTQAEGVELLLDATEIQVRRSLGRPVADDTRSSEVAPPPVLAPANGNNDSDQRPQFV